MTTASAATWNWRRRWASTACASTRRSKSPRYLYWADVLGLLVWEEMPSAYRFTRDVDRAADARMDRARSARDVSHPCIIAWVPFNESLGRARSAGQPGAAALRAGAVSPDEDARSDAAGDRQRRMGERGDRHHRHSRLRRSSRRASRSATASTRFRTLFKRERPGGRMLLAGGPRCRSSRSC